MKILQVQPPAQSQFQYMVFCPGCKCGHGLRVGQKDGPNWTFNGDMEKPTFFPSLRVRGKDFTEKGRKEYEAWQDAGSPKNHVIVDGKIVLKKFETIDTVCHSYIENGNIRFLDDCTHELAGKTVPLPEF